jgi:hypothetical protein
MSTARCRLFVFGLALASAAPLAAGAAFTVEVKIPLGNIVGRIDHLAYDSARQRLYVAELGNDSVGIVDLKERRLLRTVAGFKEPQGIGYEASTDTVYVANGGDGSLRLFRGGFPQSAPSILARTQTTYAWTRRRGASMWVMAVERSRS